MKTYHLEFTQTLPITIDAAWDFFSSPKNLRKITPEKMGFQITFQSGGEKMYAGQLIKYKINIFPFVKSSWLTEITYVQKPYFFVDEQRQGPYSLWHHQHHFEEIEGGTKMLDIISYSIPLGIIGRMMNYLFIHQQINRIFEYRKKVLSQFFNEVK